MTSSRFIKSPKNLLKVAVVCTTVLVFKGMQIAYRTLAPEPEFSMEQITSITRPFDDLDTAKDVVTQLKKTGFKNIVVTPNPHKKEQSSIIATMLPASCNSGDPCQKHALTLYFRFENGLRTSFAFDSGPHYE